MRLFATRHWRLQLCCLLSLASFTMTACRRTENPVALLGNVTSIRQDDQVTFTRDIAPVVFERCGGCHRPGQSGPFSLLTHRDLQKRVSQVVDVVERRIMPPWLPEPGHVAFSDDLSLTTEQIALFRAWKQQGCLEGDPADLPELPAAPPAWQLGQPDLVLTMPQPFDLPADGSDVYRSFVLPIPLAATKYVQAFEFRPGNPRVVHHANMSIDSSSASRERDAADPDYGFEGMALEATGLDSMFNGWAPGIRPDPGRPDMSSRVEPGDDFVLQLHMTPSGKAEQVQAQIGLHFAKRPPTRHPLLVRLGSYAIKIPAGDDHYEVTDSYTLPVDVQVLGVNPHAHYLARTIESTATTPSGKRLPLLKITNWDFNWQGRYRYEEPIALPRGSRIHVTFGFDNSSANPRNPRNPPEQVLYGPRTADEMADLWLLVLTEPGQREKLFRDVSLRELIRRIDGYTNEIKFHPSGIRRALAHDSLGTIFLAKGMVNDASHHFSRALKINADCLPAHLHLAGLFQRRREYDAAKSHLHQVLRSHPGHAASHYLLGQIAEAQQDRTAAISHYRSALEIDGQMATARQRLDQLLKTK